MFDLRRREFITLLGGAAAAWPLAARAQQSGQIRRISVLMAVAENDPQYQAHLAAFREEFQKLGWTEGRNVRIDYRWAAADPDRMRTYAAELVRMTPDVILAHTPPVLAAVQQQTRAIPIVFVQVVDPVGAGFIQSLAKPGGNATGPTEYEFAMGGKWLELLKEIAPATSRIAVILMPEHATNAGLFRAIGGVAPSVGVQVTRGAVRGAAEVERVIDELAHESNGGLIVLPSPITLLLREQIIALAIRHRLPAVYPFRLFTVTGGLMSYGINPTDQFRKAASYVDRILKGEKPGELPVEAPNKFDLVVNLKTAKAVGLTIPETFLGRADEVIE
jgi:putative ABC transport system substrate-binding protein